MPKNVTKVVEIRVGQVWLDLDDRCRERGCDRYIVVTRLTGQHNGQRDVGFYAARCDCDGRFPSQLERRYQTAAFARRVGHKSGFALHKDVR